MRIINTEIAGLVVIEPRVFEDSRGFFMETFHAKCFTDAGLPENFVQDNHSRSTGGTLRGLHYQIEHPQGKLVRCIRGEIFDVAVDMRQDSPTLGRWFGCVLSEANRKQVYVPEGLAHGFYAITEIAEIVYKCTDLYYPQHERTLLWSDSTIGVRWPGKKPLLSEKDRQGVGFSDAEKYSAGLSESPIPSRC
jgi:dTDP-4-dehydrorhamnose 3,5-epimerase